MTPATPSISTLAICDSITEAYESYKDSKTKFPLPVMLTMLAAVAGTCVRVFTLFIYILFTANEHSNRNSSLTAETLIHFLGYYSSFNRSFVQMTIDNIFNGEVEAKTAPKEKDKKRATPKVR